MKLFLRQAERVTLSQAISDTSTPEFLEWSIEMSINEYKCQYK